MYSVKVELKLNNREKTIMNKHIGFSRFCYNYALSIYTQLDHKRYKGGSSKKIDLIRKIFTNVTKKHPSFSWTKQMSSRVYQNAFKNLKAAFSRKWNNGNGFPRFKRKKDPGSFTVDSSNGVILQKGGKQVKLPTLGLFKTKEAIPSCVSQTYTVSKLRSPIKPGGLRLPIDSALWDDLDIKTPWFLGRLWGDRYYVSFSINAELIPPIQHQRLTPVGIDVNLSDGKYCVISDGTTVTFPKPLKAAITKLKKFQYYNRNKQLGNRKLGQQKSNNTQKYYNKLAKFHKKVADRRNDFLQKLTTELARKYRHIKIETLNIKGMMANGKLAIHIADASFYKFKTLLENKIKTHGGILESVDMWYASSKLCSNCGNKKTDLKLSDRIYRCSVCKTVLCRDLNSSIILAKVEVENITNRVTMNIKIIWS